MKFERVKGDVPVFSQDYDGRDRTIFGGTEQSNDINDQFTDEFKKGWGIVGKNEFPTLQDFNALGFTHSTLLSYLYQAGVPEWDSTTEYYKGSVVTYNNEAWISKKDKPTEAPTNAQNDWKLIIAGEYVGAGKWVRETGVNKSRLSDMGVHNSAQTSLDDAKDGDFGLYNIPEFGWFHVGTQLIRVAGGKFIAQFGQSMTTSELIYRVKNGLSGQFTKFSVMQNDINTRTDKNNVLHSGTGTPLNTLNVSDMVQDVVNRDDVTVTSGAVYRGLAKKRDKTDNVFNGWVTVQGLQGDKPVILMQNSNGQTQGRIGADGNGVFITNRQNSGQEITNTMPQTSGRLINKQDLDDAIPVGVIVSWDHAVAPKNWLFVRDQKFSAAEYPELAKLYPSLTLNDRRGTVDRALDAGRGFDAGRVLGSYQEDAMQKITFEQIGIEAHSSSGATGALSKEGLGLNGVVFLSGSSQVMETNFRFDSSRQVRTSTETRMKNIATNKIIKAK